MLAFSIGDGGVFGRGGAAVVSVFEIGADAAEGRNVGFGSGASRDVVRVGRLGCAGGMVTEVVLTSAVVFASCESALTAGLAAGTASKLNGLLWSLGGGSGERGDISCSFGISGFNVGEGVISGVRVSTFILGIGGAGLCACETTSQLINFLSAKSFTTTNG